MPKLLSNAVTLFVSVEFAKAIKKKFEEWDAFKLGLIDIKGNLLKKPKSKDEKDALSPLMNLIRKVKKILIKVMPDSPFINFMLAASLLKESKYKSEHFKYWKSINEDLSLKERNTLHKIIIKLNELNIVEDTTASDMPTDPTDDKPISKYNGCRCFDVDSKMFFDMKLQGRQKYERFIKHYPDTEVADYCRGNKGATFYLRDKDYQILRKIKAK